jgi:heptosyltransferase-2
MKKKTAKKKRRQTIEIPDCRRFTGFKPCFPGTKCYQECVDPLPIGKRILIINLDAMGNVLVTTALLPAIKRKYPVSHISWITLKNAAPLLANNPYLDRVYVWEPEAWMVLGQMQFDVALNVDKSARSCAFAGIVQAKQKLGFGLNRQGVIVPLNKEARGNYILGLDDHLKFRVNKKPDGQILCETFRLKFENDEYVLNLSAEEMEFCLRYRNEQGIRDDEVVVGLNTGCSELYPNKKLRIDQHVELVRLLEGIPGVRVALVGGPEDTLRNAEIARQVNGAVLSTPTNEGLRRGLCYLNICDLVISGDSFGLHAAIGLKKQVIAWFGVTSAAEIDVFDRGDKLVPEGLHCSPCWKRECPYNLECIDMVDLRGIVSRVGGFAALRRG